MDLAKMCWWWMLVLGWTTVMKANASPTGVSGGFVLGAQWFVKNQNEGTSGQYLTTDYKDKVVKVGFEKVADKVYHNFQTGQSNFFMIVGVIIFEVVMVVGIVYNHYASYVKMVKKGARRSNPNVI
jgi:hypothetical protein